MTSKKGTAWNLCGPISSSYCKIPDVLILIGSSILFFWIHHLFQTLLERRIGDTVLSNDAGAMQALVDTAGDRLVSLYEVWGKPEKAAEVLAKVED